MTVGTGISPAQPEWLVGYTTGKEFHLSPKIIHLFFDYIIRSHVLQEGVFAQSIPGPPKGVFQPFGVV